jgi:5-methylcytosine-specific restriction endonuclease McrA
MSRSTPEWIAKHDDQSIPPRVRLRVFERHGGICHISKRKIMPGEAWDCDHFIALINGGEHREANLRPALQKYHRIKTVEDVKEKAVTARKRMANLGIKPKRKSIQSAGFRPPAKQHSASRPISKSFRASVEVGS